MIEFVGTRILKTTAPREAVLVQPEKRRFKSPHIWLFLVRVLTEFVRLTCQMTNAKLSVPARGPCRQLVAWCDGIPCHVRTTFNQRWCAQVDVQYPEELHQVVDWLHWLVSMLLPPSAAAHMQTWITQRTFCYTVRLQLWPVYVMKASTRGRWIGCIACLG